jgi:SAM-dependent methyltransferase
MTDEQLEVARRHVDFHAEAFGHTEPNVEFIKGNIQDLQSAGLADDAFDLVVSNCVLNLASDKSEVFREIARVLKPGGELYFSDVFTDRRVPEEYFHDEVLLGECLSGALYVEDFRRLVEEIFGSQYFVLTASPIELHDPDIVAKVGDITFYSLTVRIIHVPLEDREENYGHTVQYNGGIVGSESEFIFDQRFRFPVGRAVHVPGNVAAALQGSRYASTFTVDGSRDKHLGPFVSSETQILRAIEVNDGSSCCTPGSSCDC